jgi:hypothetical protein
LPGSDLGRGIEAQRSQPGTEAEANAASSTIEECSFILAESDLHEMVSRHRHDIVILTNRNCNPGR